MDRIDDQVETPGPANCSTHPGPLNALDLFTSLGHSLHLLSRWGCRGFQCSEEVRDMVLSWSATGPEKSQRDSLEHIKAEVAGCRRCEFHQFRRQALAGDGRPDADLVFVGHMPNCDEDKSASLFQGPSGALLLNMITAMKQSREDIFFCHLVKCYPGEGHYPTTADGNVCLPFLQRQLSCLKPKVICALGEQAAQCLLGKTESIHELRGHFYTFENARLMATLDPGHLLAHPEDKRLVWEDLKKIMTYLGIAR